MAFSSKARGVCYSLALWALSGTPRAAVSFSIQSQHTPLCTHRALSTLSTSSSLNMSEQQTEVDVGANLQEVIDRIQVACKDNGHAMEDVRLVAVSKTKPLALLKQAYASGQRVFGESYAQELVEKAKEMDEDNVQWHFIGGLQSNKANMLVKGVVPFGKLVIETVATAKVANKLNDAMADFEEKKLAVMVQVNTSGEEAKSGVTPDEAIQLCQHIITDCPRLDLMGLMTIGAIGDISNFETLSKCRDSVAEALGMDPKSLELSMGMSGDFEEAIKYGATNVRVGSTIFGERDYSKK
mmetsp:Transcript_24347/g.39790  ORF Transcript_24347/g.39790 Transcript_24347/m.39790 type:complete len:297 (+) Transcript_24347:26-916(+)